jgi:hypothetical protein
MRTGLAILAICAFAGPALAGLPNDGLRAKDIADWLKHRHLDAEVDPARKDAAATVIRVQSAGAPFAIYLYDCRKDRCASMQYSAGVAAPPGMTTARVNAWNRQSRYVRAYLDASGRVWGEYDLDIAPGLDQKALDHSLARWLSAEQRFRLFASLP